MKIINSFRNEYAFLSNFYSCTVPYKGIEYQNAEAAFQAQKCTTEKEKEAFANASAPDAKRMGRKVSLRKDWEDVKVTEMQGILKAKFDANPDLKEKLLDLSEAYLEEGNDWGDKVWGTVNGSGRNLLGQLLMELRDDYAQELENLYEKC